jgi:hypothetical protein
MKRLSYKEIAKHLEPVLEIYQKCELDSTFIEHLLHYKHMSDKLSSTEEHSSAEYVKLIRDVFKELSQTQSEIHHTIIKSKMVIDYTLDIKKTQEQLFEEFIALTSELRTTIAQQLIPKTDIEAEAEAEAQESEEKRPCERISYGLLFNTIKEADETCQFAGINTQFLAQLLDYEETFGEPLQPSKISDKEYQDLLKHLAQEFEAVQSDFRQNISSAETDINSFDPTYHYEEDEFEQYLNDMSDAPVRICGCEYKMGSAWRAIDPTAFRCAYSDHLSTFSSSDMMQFEAYRELIDTKGAFEESLEAFLECTDELREIIAEQLIITKEDSDEDQQTEH